MASMIFEVVTLGALAVVQDPGARPPTCPEGEDAIAMRIASSTASVRRRSHEVNPSKIRLARATVPPWLQAAAPVTRYVSLVRAMLGKKNNPDVDRAKHKFGPLRGRKDEDNSSGYSNIYDGRITDDRARLSDNRRGGGGCPYGSQRHDIGQWRNSLRPEP
jgi:hypothetical protein